MSKKIEISNGPSREELFDGLRLSSEKRLVPFCIKENDTERYIAVILSSIEAEDGSGQSWNLTFSLNERYTADQFFIDKPVKKESGVLSKKIDFETFRHLAEEDYLLGECRKDLIRVKVYYSTKKRSGVIIVK